nr:hypothetical protein [Bradyrhizobium sp. 6(2017)]QIG91064.1 hypothetical protein G6P99_00005 [Bradyrhizobium sp. 6(2017)]
MATVTTPVEASMAKRPPASSLSENVTVPPLTSLEVAVMPTRSPGGALPKPVLAALLPSTGWVGATSVTAMVKVWVVKAPWRRRLDGESWLVVVSKSSSEALATVTTPVEASMAKRPRGVVAERERDGAAVDVARGRGDADQVAVGGAFRNRVGGIVAVDRLGRRHVGDGNGEGLGGEGAAGRPP